MSEDIQRLVYVRGYSETCVCAGIFKSLCMSGDIQRLVCVCPGTFRDLCMSGDIQTVMYVQGHSECLESLWGVV